MKVLTDILQIDREDWRTLIENSQTATWFQTPEAYALFASMPDMFRPFAIAIEDCRLKDEDCKLRGVCVGYVTKEKNPIKQFFTRRAVIIGGPVIAEDCSDEEVYTLMVAVRQRLQILDFRFKILDGPIYIETRNFNDYSRWKGAFEKAGFKYEPHYDMHIKCDGIDRMWERMSESKRRAVSKAQADGVEICEAKSVEDVHEFYVMLKQLYRQKVKRPLMDESFFRLFVRERYGILLLVKQKGKIIGGMLCPIMDGKALYEWYVVGPAIVTWAAMQYAQKKGLQILDLMGAGEPNVPYGVRDFKKQMGGELKEYGRFVRVNNKILYAIGKMGVEILKRC